MKKTLFLIALLGCFAAFSQSIIGTVVDEKNEPLPGATIYFDGSSYGTITNFEGKFSITIPSQITSALVISFVGFEKVYLKDLKFDTQYRIVLKENIEDLKEVIVTNNFFSRKQMMQVFRNQFLGTTKAGNQCKIENEDEIYFSYDNNKFILIAYADKPLIIDNPYLGYKVYFDLSNFNTKFNKFSIDREDVYSSLYVGTSRFVELNNSTKNIKNREKVYNGSYLQLFRNMGNQEWNKETFLLYNGRFKDNPDNHLFIKDTLEIKQVYIKPQVKSLKPQGFVAEFSLLYNNKEQSKIIFYTNNFNIDRFGLFSDYDKIYFSGALSEKKVGDLLPSNYGIE